MLPIYDYLSGERVGGELLRSQEFRTGRCPHYVSRGVIEVGTQIREVRVRREPDMHGNRRVSEQRHQVDFDTALGSLKVQLKQEGNVTEVMPEYVKESSSCSRCTRSFRAGDRVVDDPCCSAPDCEVLTARSHYNCLPAALQRIEDM